MAFRYIDDDAITGSVDSTQLASFHGRRCAANFRAVHDERLPQNGWVVPAGKTQRICSPWPVAYPGALLRLPVGERYEEITVEVNYDLVDFDGEDAEADAVDICATVMQPDTGLFEPPEPPAEVWTAAGLTSGWTTLGKTASAGSTTLTARIPAGITGPWVLVLIWIRSRVATASEGTYQITGHEVLSGFQISKSSGTDLASSSIPERAVQLISDESGNQTNQGLGQFMIGYYSDGGPGSRSVWVYPYIPLSAPASSAAYLDTYPLGVLELTSVDCSPVAPTVYPAPGPAAFATNQPMSQTMLQLAEATDSLLRRRQPQPGCWAGLSKIDTIGPMYGTDSGAVWAALDDTNWTPIRTFYVDEETALHPTLDSGGWSVAFLSAVRNIGATSLAGYETLIEYRVASRATAAITPGVTGTLGTASDTLRIIHPSVGSPWARESTPMLAHTLWGAYEFEAWQAAGQMMGSMAAGRPTGDPGRHDLRVLSWGEIRLPEDTTYPCYVSLEARTPTAYEICLQLWAAGCARADEVRI